MAIDACHAAMISPLELQGDDNNNELELVRQDAAASPERDGDGGTISEDSKEAKEKKKSQPRSQNKRRRKAAQAKAAVEANARKESGTGDEESAAYKKCQGPCGKRKLSDQFNADQAKLNIRSFWKNAKCQKVETEMKELEQKDPNTFKEILKEYCRARESRAEPSKSQIQHSGVQRRDRCEKR